MIVEGYMKNTMQNPKRLFLALLSAWAIAVMAAAATGTHVGIVTSMESGTFKLVNEFGENDLVKGAKLFPGDVIKKPAAAKPPEIMWWPYAGWKDPGAAEKLEVAFQPPPAPEKKGFLQKVTSFLGFVETDYATVHGVADETKEMQRENKFDDAKDETQNMRPSASSLDSGKDSRQDSAHDSAQNSALDSNIEGIAPPAAAPSS